MMEPTREDRPKHASGGPAVEGSGRRRVTRPWAILARAKGSFTLLLGSLIALMAATPLVPVNRMGTGLLSVFTGILLVASLHAVQPGSRAVAIGLVLAVLDLLVGQVIVAFESKWLILVDLTLWLVTLVYVTWTIVRAIFDVPDVSLQTLEASLCVYLLIGLIGAFAYSLVELVLPGSFRPVGGPNVVWTNDHLRAVEFRRLFVFSFATLSGSGQADVTPASGFAANAASFHSMTGQIYLAVVIARLVGRHSSKPSHHG